jgi:hypothetical protein
MATPTPARSRPWGALSGAAILFGASLMAVKSLAILASGVQPPLLFEAAPAFLGIGVLLLSPALDLHGTRRWIVAVLGLIATVVGFVAAATEIAGEVSGAALGISTLAAVTGAVVTGWRPRGDVRRRALVVVGLVVIPAMLIGGMLSEIDERLLEVGLLAYAGAWGIAGFRLISHPSLDVDVRSSGPSVA